MKTKVLSVIEVVVVFIFMVCLFRYIQTISLSEIEDPFNDLSFQEYAVLLIASIAIYTLRNPNRRS